MTVRYLDLEDDSWYMLYRLLHCSIHDEIENVANEGEESQYLLLILLLNFGLLELDFILMEHSRFDKELARFPFIFTFIHHDGKSIQKK